MDITLNEVAGHAAFALSAAAYSMRRIVWLRAFALVSLALSLYYNLTLPGGVLWLVVFWLSVFVLINIGRIAMDIMENLEAQLDPFEKQALAGSFPSMHSRDWKKMVQKGSISRFPGGMPIFAVGQQTEHLFVLINGEITEVRASGKEIPRDVGLIWGELTYVMGNEVFDEGSPCSFISGQRGATVFKIPYEALRELSNNNDRFRGALLDGFLRSAGFRHGVMEQGNLGITKPAWQARPA